MDELEFRENVIDVDTYLKLRASVGWKVLTREQAGMALKGSLYTVGLYIAGQPVGMGRLVGDGAVICYIQDLIVHPNAQGLGVGHMLMERLIAHTEALTQEGTEMMLDLMCAKGREAFYRSHGFLARPTKELGPGMIRYLDKRRSLQEDRTT
ncbi:MAG: GNAT family N-acetyltransferase [Lachnospiraceae bacterium]|nr:GNAT family N-acetyltransferase [Lachnospiraceae bacterium]